MPLPDVMRLALIRGLLTGAVLLLCFGVGSVRGVGLERSASFLGGLAGVGLVATVATVVEGLASRWTGRAAHLAAALALAPLAGLAMLAAIAQGHYVEASLRSSTADALVAAVEPVLAGGRRHQWWLYSISAGAGFAAQCYAALRGWSLRGRTLAAPAIGGAAGAIFTLPALGVDAAIAPLFMGPIAAWLSFGSQCLGAIPETIRASRQEPGEPPP